MNRIKTTERNHLLPQTLGSLIMISLNGPPVEIWRNENIHDYIRHWHNVYNVSL